MDKRPWGIVLIGYLYLLSAVMVILSVVLGTEWELGMALRFGVPGVPENIVRMVVAVFSLVMVTGYLRLEKWGYWVMMSYSVVYLIISANLLITTEYTQPFLGNAIWAAFTLVYTYVYRMRFASGSERG